MKRIAVLGGSGAATPELAWCLAASELARRERLQLVLVGRSGEKLARVAAAARAIAGGTINVDATTDVTRGVSGADFVVNQVRIGGLAARAFDETFPRQLGIPGEETVGPGGFANALRTLPRVLELATCIEREAPEAWVVNLTNPAGMVQQLVERVTRLRCITVCDSPLTLVERARGWVGDCTAGYAGLNHAGFILELRDGSGRDVLPAAVAACAADPSSPVAAEVVRALGCLPNPYMRFYYTPDRMLAVQTGKRPRAEELIDLERELLAAYVDGGEGRPEALARRGAAWYAKGVVPVIEALAGCSEREIIVCHGNGGLLPWLPAEAAVEVPAVIGTAGIEKRRGLMPPIDIASVLGRIAAYEVLVVEGVLEHDESKLLRGLMCNPLIPSHSLAVEVLRLARSYER